MGFFQQLEQAITGNDGTGQDGGSFIPGIDNPFQSSQTVWLPGLGSLNPLNSQSAVGQLTKDLGQLNPFNPDSTAGKVVNNISQDMSKDPAKWVAIAAAVATGQTYLIPYINATATLTSKNASPEEWLKEGAKAAIISTGGQYVANNVSGLGPQTDITTGETFAGTGAAGATSSAQAGAVAGNIARNIFSTAARKGSTDINSAQIVTGAITNEALNEAFKYLPGYENLSKAEQSATVNAFKTAFNKDSNAAYQLFNQGFDATVKGLNDAAKRIGYKDLNEQNAVNNFVMNQGSTEDIDALTRYEQKTQDAYNAYAPLKEKNDTWFKKNDEYADALQKYYKLIGDPMVALEYKSAAYRNVLNQWNWLQDPNNYYAPDQVTAAEQAYNSVKAEAEPFFNNLATLQSQGWDSLTQQKAALAAGYTTPESYNTYLTDEAERLRLAGLQEKDVDLNKVVDTGTTDEEQAKRVADFGKDLTGGGVQDLGDVDTKTSFYDADSTGTGAYKYDPTSGTYTYTSDDGSTLTLDGEGNVVGVTEATDTSWTGLTDPSTGNLKLPKLPGGLTPTVKAPAKQIPTPGAGTAVTPTGGSTAVQSGGTASQAGLNIPALLAIMGGLDQQPQQVQQVQEETPEFQYFDWEASPFAPTKDKTNPSGQPKMASGGSIDEILEILRRSGI